MLARAGWHLWQVQYMGRWASDAVAGYVEEAWAERTADWTGPAGPGAAFAQTGSLHLELRSLRASIQELDTMVADCKRPPAVQSGPGAEEIQAEAERQAARRRCYVSRSGFWRKHVALASRVGGEVSFSPRTMCGLVTAGLREVEDTREWVPCNRCRAAGGWD